MNPSLPREIRVEPNRLGVRYRLPARRLGMLKLIGLFPLVFGLFFSGFAVFWMLGASGFLNGKTPDVGSLIFSAFGIPFFLVGLVPAGLGMFILAGRCDVELDGRTLLVTERAGPFRWRRRRTLDGLRRLLVPNEPVKVNGKPVTSGPLASFGALAAEFANGKPWLVAIGYPREWLLALTGDLLARLQAQGITAEISEAAPDATALSNFVTAAVDADRHDQPQGSNIRVESTAGGLLLVVPPVGLRKGGKGLFMFGLIWCLFVGAISAVLLFAALKGSFKKPGEAWAAVGFLSLFWLAGFGFLAGAINMGRRRAVISANARELKVARQSPFGAKTWAWARDDIASVGVGPSGIEVNGRPVNELQVRAQDGRKTGFFSERDDEELRWMATVLRAALQITRQEADAPPKP